MANAWRTSFTSIGTRYNLAYLGLGNRPITAATLAEMKRVINLWGTVKVVSDPKPLGRVISVNVESKQSASALNTLKEYVFAGGATSTDAIQFQLMNVTPLASTQNSTLPANITRVITAPVRAGYEAGKNIADKVGEGLGGILPKAGDIAGATLANVIKPILLPVVIIAVAYLLLATGKGRGFINL